MWHGHHHLQIPLNQSKKSLPTIPILPYPSFDSIQRWNCRHAQTFQPCQRIVVHRQGRSHAHCPKRNPRAWIWDRDPLCAAIDRMTPLISSAIRFAFRYSDTYNGALIKRRFETISNNLAVELTMVEDLSLIDISIDLCLLSHPSNESWSHLVLLERISIPFARVTNKSKDHQCKLVDVRCAVTFKCQLPNAFLDDEWTCIQKHLACLDTYFHRQLSVTHITHHTCLITLIQPQEPIDKALELKLGKKRVLEILTDDGCERFGILLDSAFAGT